MSPLNLFPPGFPLPRWISLHLPGSNLLSSFHTLNLLSLPPSIAVSGEDKVPPSPEPKSRNIFERNFHKEPKQGESPPRDSVTYDPTGKGSAYFCIWAKAFLVVAKDRAKVSAVVRDIKGGSVSKIKSLILKGAGITLTRSSQRKLVGALIAWEMGLLKLFKGTKILHAQEIHRPQTQIAYLESSLHLSVLNPLLVTEETASSYQTDTGQQLLEAQNSFPHGVTQREA